MPAIAIFNYPGALKSAVFGWQEMFELCNSVDGSDFDVRILESPCDTVFDVVLIPPAAMGYLPTASDPSVLQWLMKHHDKGKLVCSACAGAFLLAQTGLLADRLATTHWGLAEQFRKQFPNVQLRVDLLLISTGNIVTAGGLMSWLDLGLEVVRRLKDDYAAIRLGKMLVIDTAPREQRYYQEFMPQLSTRDDLVRAAQEIILEQYIRPLEMANIASSLNCSERTLQRRFRQELDMSPKHYLQRVRVDKICKTLLTSRASFESIAHKVGYEDVSACRKSFKSIVGLSPRAFRSRFIA